MNTNAIATTKATLAAKIGSVVRYSDMGNPGMTFVVVGINDNPWSTFVLRSVEAPYELTTTDGRQRGWKVVAA
jgi:hypothetical protein